MNLTRNRYLTIEQRAEEYADQLRKGRDIEGLKIGESAVKARLRWLLIACAFIFVIALAFAATAHFFGTN